MLRLNIELVKIKLDVGSPNGAFGGHFQYMEAFVFMKSSSILNSNLF